MSDISIALELFQKYIPANTTLTIEETDSHLIYRYIFRLTYTSKSSGRTMCMIAKGEALPAEEGDLMYFYLRQLILTPAEQGREFSRLYFLERRARQEGFLRDGSTGQGERGSLVYDKAAKRDRMEAKDYNAAAQLDALT